MAFLLGTLWLILTLAPFDYMLVSAFRSQATYFTADPWVPAGGLTLGNVSAVWDIGLGSYIRNSAIVTVCGVLLTLALSLMFAMHTVKHRTRAGSLMFKVISIGLAIPIQAIVVPLYLVVLKIDLYNTLIGLVLVLTASALPFSIVVMTTFVRDIPDELIQAMRVDGAGSWRILWSLVLPMSKGALGLIAIFNGLAMWNNLLIPLLFTAGKNNALLPLALYLFEGQYGSNVPAIMMAVVISALPLIILFIASRKSAMQALGGIATMR